MGSTHPSILDSLDGVLEDRPEHGVHRVDRGVFCDPELFEFELRYIFEGTWIYMAHESQIPANVDRVTELITKLVHFG